MSEYTPIFIRTISGKVICINNYNPNDTIQIFKKKFNKEVDRINRPSVLKHIQTRLGLVKQLCLVRNRYIKLYDQHLYNNHQNKIEYLLFLKIPFNVWKYILTMVFPFNNVPLIIPPILPFNSKTHTFKFILEGKLLQDTDKCHGWYAINGIFVIPTPK